MVKPGTLELVKVEEFSVPTKGQLYRLREGTEFYSHPFKVVFSRDNVKSNVVKPSLFNGGAENEGVRKIHLTDQGCKRRCCRRFRGAIESEDLDGLNHKDVKKDWQQ